MYSYILYYVVHHVLKYIYNIYIYIYVTQNTDKIPWPRVSENDWICFCRSTASGSDTARLGGQAKAIPVPGGVAGSCGEEAAVGGSAWSPA